MGTQWQQLGKPAVFGFLLGLIVTGAIVYAVPGAVGGSATAVSPR